MSFILATSLPAFSTFSTLPLFLTYIGLSAIAMVVFTAVYMFLTPHNELKLIRQGNVPTAVVMLGAWIGVALPLAVLIIRTANPVDFLLWAGVAMAVQYSAFLVSRVLLGGWAIPVDGSQPCMSRAITVVALNVTAGILNAACMI